MNMGSKNKVKRKKHEESEDRLFESDETFAFIAGYTSGGVPYGVTWEEMEEIERRDTELLGKEEHGHNCKKLDLPFD